MPRQEDAHEPARPVDRLPPSLARATSQIDTGLPVNGIVPGVTGVPLGAAVLPPQRDTLILGTASVGLEFRY